MSENKKRGGSFRKIFPNLFFSNKTKEKTSNKNIQPIDKSISESTSKSNQYQNPRSVIEQYENQFEKPDDIDDRIYENLSTASFRQINDSINNNEALSNHSSSSTLVSENIKHSHITQHFVSSNKNITDDVKYMARPQVPPKPQNEVLYASPVPKKNTNNLDSGQYPDVYYHSLEKLIDKISPLDEIKIYKASQAQVNPASVGAEIKKVSTKFLISPKKEAEVRKIQPIRARSLSLDKQKITNVNEATTSKEGKVIEKPYNYSAPTSPISVSHKIPNMPTTVSPHEHFRKTIIETEAKRDSTNRSYSRNKFTPSPTSSHDLPKSPVSLKCNSKIGNTLNKERTRRSLEAYYWQKIKELKQKEDEYLLRQSMNQSSLTNPKAHNPTYSTSNCSTPNSLVLDYRNCSLPLNDSKCNIDRKINSPVFIRGAPERRTDSYLSARKSDLGAEVIYRHPKKIYGQVTTKNYMPIFQRGSLTYDSRNVVHLPKRVSFDEQKKNLQKERIIEQPYGSNRCSSQPHNSVQISSKFALSSERPPPPPLRTTSVLGANRNQVRTINKTIVNRSVCSESESGSEAGEIQRILQNSSRNGQLNNKIL